MDRPPNHCITRHALVRQLGFIAIMTLALINSRLLFSQEAEDQEFPPIGNHEFFGLPTTSQVTQNFEIYDPHSAEELKAVKAMGFDQVILDRAPLHTEATQLGLDVVIANWWTDETKQDVIDGMLRLASEVDPRHLVAISVMDEPERNSPDTPFQFYVDLYQQLKPKLVGPLEGARLEISYWGPLVNWDQRYYDYFSYLYESADAMRIMPYPDLHEDPLGDVYLMMRRSDRAMRLAQVDIPQIVILQTWVLPPQNKLPTIDELRVMAYQAMLGGAETLSFFEYRPEVWQKSPGFEEQFTQLMAELVSLRSQLQGAEIVTRLDENGLFSADAGWTNGRQIEIRVNTNRSSLGNLAALEVAMQETAPASHPQTTLDARVACRQSSVVCQTPSTHILRRTPWNHCSPKRLGWLRDHLGKRRRGR